MSSILAQDAENLPLNADVGGGSVNGGHFGIRGLQADHTSLTIETFERGVRTIDQGHDDLAFARCSCPLHQDVVAGDDVLVTHGVAADL